MTSDIDRLALLVQEATTLALECYSEGDEAPFVLAMDRRRRSQLFCLDSGREVDLTEILKLGRALMAGPKWECAVLVYSGYMPIGDCNRHAVVVLEPAKERLRLPLLIVQPYLQANDSYTCEAVLEPLVLEC